MIKVHLACPRKKKDGEGVNTGSNPFVLCSERHKRKQKRRTSKRQIIRNMSLFNPAVQDLFVVVVTIYLSGQMFASLVSFFGRFWNERNTSSNNWKQQRKERGNSFDLFGDIRNGFRSISAEDNSEEKDVIKLTAEYARRGQLWRYFTF